MSLNHTDRGRAIQIIEIWSHVRSLTNPRHIATITFNPSTNTIHIQAEHPNLEALLREPILIYDRFYTPEDGAEFMDALEADWRKCRMYSVRRKEVVKK